MERVYNRQRDVLEGLTIFMAHGGIDISAEHDVIHAGQKEGEILSQDEVDRLLAAGWHIDPEFCDCGLDFEEDDDTDEHKHDLGCTAWAIFT